MIKEVYHAFIRLHILHHAAQEPIFGLGILRELQRHGYSMSPGTLYPMLHRMEQAGLLSSERQVVSGKVRRFYSITKLGLVTLTEAKHKVRELFAELIENEFLAEPTAGTPPGRDREVGK